jgi:hypothetical protein
MNKKSKIVVFTDMSRATLLDHVDAIIRAEDEAARESVRSRSEATPSEQYASTMLLAGKTRVKA